MRVRSEVEQSLSLVMSKRGAISHFPYACVGLQMNEQMSRVVLK